MYTPSSNFLTKIKEPSRILKAKIEIAGSRNMCPLTYATYWESGDYNATTGVKYANSARIRLKDLLQVSPSTTYYVNTYETDATYTINFVIRLYDQAGNFVRSLGGVNNGATFTTASNEVYIGVALYDTAGTITDTILQNDLNTGIILPYICLNSETLKTYVPYSTTILTEENISEFSIETVLGTDTLPTIGGVVASKLDMTCLIDGVTPSYWTTQNVKPYVGVKLDSGFFEYVPMGVFKPNLENITKTKKTIKIECNDNLVYLGDIPYTSALTFPATVTAVCNEITANTGIEFANLASLPSASIKTEPTDKSVRQVLGDIGELVTCNAVINRYGKVEFKFLTTQSFSVDASNYITFNLLSDDNVQITKLVVEKSDNTTIEYGTSTGYTMSMQNDSITTVAELQTIYNRAFPLTYWSYECTLQGMPHLDAGDKITLTDVNSVVRTIPILSHSVRFSGGLSSTIKAGRPNSMSTSTGSVGTNSITQSLKKVNADMEIVNTVLAGNITADNIMANSITGAKLVAGTITAREISASTITADKLVAGTITASSGILADAVITTAKIADGQITSAKIASATITNANIANGTITSANIQDATIVNGDIANATITGAKIASATITSANIASATITSANIASATITGANIASATIGTANIATSAITTALIATSAIGTAQIANSSITDAKIVSLTANKLTAGTIDASVINVTNLTADNITTGSLTIDGDNLIHNSAWSTNSDTWILSTGWTRDTTVTYNGSYTMKQYQTGQTSDHWYPLYSEAFACTAGETFVITGYFMTDDLSIWGGGSASIDIDFFDSVGTRLSYPASNSVPSQINVWERFMVSGTAPANTASCRWRCHINRNGRLWVARPMLQRGSVASEWKMHTDENISAGAISSTKLADDAVITTKIADGAVVNTHISANTITGDKLVVEAITAREIATATITANKMVVGTITAGSGILADACITTAKIGDAQITSAKIASATITSANIALATITDANIASATITSAKIASLDASKITTGTLSADRIGANSLTIGKLATTIGSDIDISANTTLQNTKTLGLGMKINYSDFVTGNAGELYIHGFNAYGVASDVNGFILNNGTKVTVNKGMLNPNAIVAGYITVEVSTGNVKFIRYNSDGTWSDYTAGAGTAYVPTDANNLFIGYGETDTAENFAFATLFTSPMTLNDVVKIATVGLWQHSSDVTKINGGKIYADTITATQIASGTITATEIASTTITGDKLVAGTITATQIASDTITATQIASGTITGTEIASNTITANKMVIGDSINYIAWYDKTSTSSPFVSSVLIDTATYHSTTASFKVPINTVGCSTKNNIPVIVGDMIYCEFWAKTDSTWNGTAGNTKLRFGNQSGTLVYALSISATPNTTWTKYSGSFTVPSGTTCLQVTIGNDATVGNVWFDDMIISKKFAGTLVIDGTLSANSIKGGTLKLGGTTYGNGSAKIYNSSDVLLLDLNTNGIIGYGDSAIKTTKTVMYDATYGTRYDTALTSYGLTFQTTDIGGYGFGASAELNSGKLELETHRPAGGSHRISIQNRSEIVGDDTSGYTAFFVNQGFDFFKGNDGVSDPMTSAVQIFQYSSATGWVGFHFLDNVSFHKDVIISKDANNWSKIKFPATSNDAGYIGHYELSNASKMRFCVSDDANATSDGFEWGSDNGTFTSCAWLDTRGQLSVSNGYQVASGEGKGYKFWDSSENYKISMCSGGVGGRWSESTSDYNMYFNMGGGGTNRGFQFATNGTCFASLTPTGGFRVNGSVYSKGESQFTDGSAYSDPFSGTACAIKTTGIIGVGGYVNAYRSGGGDCFNAQNNVSTWAIHRGTSSYDMAFAPAWNWTNDVVFTSAGNVSCVSLTQRSDIKLKVNLQPLDNVLEKLDNINIYRYTLKSDIEWSSDRLIVGDNTIPSVQKHLGVIAQEVEVYFPEIVRPSSDIDDTKTVDTYGLLAVALEAIKELREEVRILKEKVGV